MNALAFSNNDIAVIAWTYDRRLDGCLGFALYRQDIPAGTETPLPALARFKKTPKDQHVTTEQAPVQKFWWKDLNAKRGGTYRYRIVPLGGSSDHPVPLAGVAPLVTNSVTLTPDRGRFKAYFNRGIVATQAIVKDLGKPDGNLLLKRVADPADEIRVRLEGQLYEGVTSLLDRSDAGEGTIRAALYELNDPKGLEVRLGAADHGQAGHRRVILGNERGVDKNKKAIDDVDSDNRQRLKDAGVNVVDRVVAAGHIPHNKFMILESATGPIAALTGSTNWTSTGLATQTNNTLVIESRRVAQHFVDYWQQLKADVDSSGGDAKKLQGTALRQWIRDHNASVLKTPVALEDNSATVEVLFSPNTKKPLATPPKEKPGDMGRLFDLVMGAKDAVLFLAFDPGNNSILDAAAAALKKRPTLFVRGTLTNAQRATNFAQALKGKGDQTPKKGGFQVAVIGEPGKPKKAAAGQPVEPDYRAIPAGRITKEDAFGAWEAELYKVGFAIIHNKVVVIDPFSDDCVVITGSHNLGYRASHNNDENMVIVRGHRPLAEAYACHVLDLYDHYAWRYWLGRFPKTFGRPLDETDKWQDRYIKGPEEKSAELRFWLSAAPAPHG